MEVFVCNVWKSIVDFIKMAMLYCEKNNVLFSHRTTY